MKRTVASSGFTAVQVGRIVPAEGQADAPPPPKPAKSGKRGVVNVRAGNAKVGVQIDGDHVGDLNIHI
jgi:hypothetical protein